MKASDQRTAVRARSGLRSDRVQLGPRSTFFSAESVRIRSSQGRVFQTVDP